MKVKEQKIAKKVSKCLAGILKEMPLVISEPATKAILICNAGLTTSCSKEELLEHFERFGIVTNFFMFPGKSYSVVYFNTIESSTDCYEQLNGEFCLEKGSRPIYLCYIEPIQDESILAGPGNSESIPNGLNVIDEFVSNEEEASLLACLEWDSSSTELKHRKVKHYGYTFLYESNNIDRENPLPGGLPKEVEPLLNRLISKGIISVKPDQLTVNQYQPGQGIPPHVDTHSAFEDTLISISLGSSIIMDFKHPDGRQCSVLLPQRSCLLMSSDARYLWTHGITPRKNDVVNSSTGGLTLQARGVRTSFTFRKIKNTPCECAFKSCCDSQANDSAIITEKSADDIEKNHVFQVYDDIASHFSDTRHKPWPEVLKFVQSLPIGSILIDVGCGNGKYIGHSPFVLNIGCDRSKNLLQVCRQRNHEVFQADCRQVTLRDGIADACIAIAVYHHLATDKRRLQAIEDISRLLRKGGRALIYVWAKEQQRGAKKSTYLLQRKNDKPSCEMSNSNLPIHENRTDFKHVDVLVPWKLNPLTASLKASSIEEKTYHRFYHVFVEGELESLCSQVPELDITRSYYDQGNWCVELTKK